MVRQADQVRSCAAAQIAVGDVRAVADVFRRLSSVIQGWRSVVTEKAFASCRIYEYANKYWIIEESRQLWPEEEGPTERVALTGSLPQCYTSLEMGELTFQALSNFNSKKPKFSPWELKELRKDLCSWVGARGWPSFYKNARYVSVARYQPSNVIRILPVDNCNIHPYESALEKFIIETTADVGAQKFGDLIRSAFLHATSHPERKK